MECDADTKQYVFRVDEDVGHNQAYELMFEDTADASGRYRPVGRPSFPNPRDPAASASSNPRHHDVPVARSRSTKSFHSKWDRAVKRINVLMDGLEMVTRRRAEDPNSMSQDAQQAPYVHDELTGWRVPGETFPEMTPWSPPREPIYVDHMTLRQQRKQAKKQQ